VTTACSRRSFLRRSAFIAAGVLLVPRIPSTLTHGGAMVSRSFLSMGSVLDITVFGESKRHCNTAIERALAEFQRVEKLMSLFDATSQVSAINWNAGTMEVLVDPAIVDVLERARQFSGLTDGAFDVTIEPLMELYGFNGADGIDHVPSDREIAGVLEGVGMQNVVVDRQNSTVGLLKPTTRIDLGGIAVGYALDHAVAALRSSNVADALINHSGDVYALGTPPGAEAWTVGIVNPLSPDETITTLSITNQALSTSGNYQKHVTIGATNIGHLLNPRTGRPATDLLSGTAVAPTAIEADAFSTGLFVMGLDTARQTLPHVSGLRFIAVTGTATGAQLTEL
jgi:thiamine biosynthesis lipoprotein